jgi:putative membrane protein insertion efficiency factor
MFVRAFLLLIRVYQLTLSRLLGPACRLEPSCSQYAAACLETHGALRGGLLSIRRVCKCHPFHPGGYDPPPSARPPNGLPPLSFEVAGRSANRIDCSD